MSFFAFSFLKKKRGDKLEIGLENTQGKHSIGFKIHFYDRDYDVYYGIYKYELYGTLFHPSNL